MGNLLINTIPKSRYNPENVWVIHHKERGMERERE
jgi:hypothetical protein